MPKAQTLGELVVERVGWRSAPRVLGVVVAWAAFVKVKGRSPTGYELAAANGSRSQKQWYRDLETFRKAFPGEESPDRIARLLVAHRQLGRPEQIYSLSAAFCGVA